MVHLDEMRQFMLQDVVLQVSRQEHKIERKVDVTFRAAAAPTAFGRRNPDGTDIETSLLSHIEKPRHKSFPDTLSRKGFQRLRYPGLNVFIRQNVCRLIVTNDACLVHFRPHIRHILLLEPQAEIFCIDMSFRRKPFHFSELHRLLGGLRFVLQAVESCDDVGVLRFATLI